MKRSVNTVIQNKAGKYLLQVRDGAEGICNPLMWNFFGGGVMDNEDPIMGAVRETQEELNVKVKSNNFELLGELKAREDRLVYVVRCKKHLEWKDVTVQEGAGAGYFSKEEMLKIDITEATRLLIMKYLD